jgi:glycosyltransferase involved in cell wall biosynthesis
MLGWEYPPHLTGGLGTACQGLASALVRGGADVTFVLPHVAGDEPDDGVRLVEAPVPASEGPYGAAGAPPGARSARDRYGGDLAGIVSAFARGTKRVARRGRFDVVHAHDWMTYAAGVAAAGAARTPLVVHVHSCEYDRAGPRANPDIVAAEQAGFDAADRIVCVSRYTARVVAAKYRVDRSKLRVVHNAGPGGAIRARRGRRRRIPEPVVLFLGRVTYQKGPGVFLEAAARVAKERRDVRFVVAGTGDLYHSTIERAAALGIGHRVHFTGFLRGADVARAYRDADVFVMPSVSEPFGIAPLEAAAHGVPVLLSERSGVAEVLPSAITFDPRSPRELAARLLEVLASPSTRRRLADRARREVARLHWDAQAERMLDVYGEVAL